MRITVLLTCYNHLAHLPEAVESIRAQTRQADEIIALDDGSTDGTREWLGHQNDLTLAFNEKNLGTYATLNRGLGQASGTHIAILNDDDVWAPSKLEQQAEAIQANGATLCHTGGRFIGAEGEILQGEPLGFPFPNGPSGDILGDLIRRNQCITSSLLFPREAALDAGGFDEGLFGSADWKMNLCLAERGEAAFCPDDLTKYRIHPGSASRRRDRVWQDDQAVREWIAERMPGWKSRLAPHHDVLAAHNWNALGVVRRLNGDAKAARAAWKSALAHGGAPLKWLAYAVASRLPRRQFEKLVA